MLRAARPSPLVDTRVIYCADNLDQLKELPDGCVDLIYLDPPFNSNRRYEAFWGEPHEKAEFDDRHGSTQAYIDFMRPRCQELARVLSKNGSFYYHCDWHACHYVKVMLDQIFGDSNFRNEIVWKRSDAHSDAKQGSKHYGRVHDTIFFFTRGKKYTFNTIYNPLPQSTIDKWYRHVEEGTGRRYNKADVTGPGGEAKGCPVYEWHGITRAWRFSRANMERLEREGRLVYSTSGMVYQKRYLDESKGVPLQSLWGDIGMLRGIRRNGEWLGFPTQKPLALLDRIIRVSSNPGDVVLDPFCGCGTAIVAAEQLGRQWIGIDKSPTACRVMAQRLRRDCHLSQSEAAWENGRGFAVRNMPFTQEVLHRLPPHEFESWAVVALGGQSKGYKGPDLGIDGRIYVPGTSHRKRSQTEFTFMTEARQAACYPIQVKQKDKVGRPDIDQFEAAVLREQAEKAIFVAFDYTRDAIAEIGRFWKTAHRLIVPLTVDEILSGDFVRKLA